MLRSGECLSRFFDKNFIVTKNEESFVKINLIALGELASLDLTYVVYLYVLQSRAYLRNRWSLVWVVLDHIHNELAQWMAICRVGEAE